VEQGAEALFFGARCQDVPIDLPGLRARLDSDACRRITPRAQAEGDQLIHVRRILVQSAARNQREKRTERSWLGHALGW
jgi:hypothetical protein